MKLSEIATFLELLRDSDVGPTWVEFHNRLNTVETAVLHSGVHVGTVAHDISTAMQNICASVKDFRGNVGYLITQLEQIIIQLEPEYYQNSWRLYEEEMRWETNQYILDRRLVIDPESEINMRARLRSYGDWRLPGMIIRPGLETHIEEMVPLDPLYVVDQHQDLITPAISKFTEQYQRRLRLYVVNDYQQNDPLKALPNGQFGLIFAYNFFNYKPIEVIETYLREFYQKLRPGGVAMFTFNNCDRPNGMGLAERNFMCYTPGRRIRSMAQNYGFEIVYNQTGPYNLDWMELRKPGEIVSLRGGQSLAQIKR